MAAIISQSGVIGGHRRHGVGPAVVSYIVGYGNGAKSINPNIQVLSSTSHRRPDAAAFNNPAGGKTFAEQFIDPNRRRRDLPGRGQDR